MAVARLILGLVKSGVYMRRDMDELETFVVIIRERQWRPNLIWDTYQSSFLPSISLLSTSLRPVKIQHAAKSRLICSIHSKSHLIHNRSFASTSR